MIHHAGLRVAPAPCTHAVAMIQSSFGTLPMTAIGGFALKAAPKRAAGLAAVLLPAITAPADREKESAGGSTAKPKPENDF